MNDAIGTKRSQQSAPAKSEPEYTAKVSAPNSQSGPQLDDQPSLSDEPQARSV
jgi:hypothetical protein